jgi:DNA helicase TIP49 (TBP-interacting protein)
VDIVVLSFSTTNFLYNKGETGEIKPEVRDQIDAKIAEWCLEKKAELVIVHKI